MRKISLLGSGRDGEQTSFYFLFFAVLFSLGYINGLSKSASDLLISDPSGKSKHSYLYFESMNARVCAQYVYDLLLERRLNFFRVAFNVSLL